MPRFEGTTEMDKIGANLRVASKSSLPRGLFLKSPDTSRVSQFPLYLRNVKGLSHQTSQSSWFFLAI